MGGGGERRKRLRANPLILKTSVRQRTELVIGWASQTLLTDLKFRVPERTFEACLQKALTFLTERVFSRELRQYGRNPVVQCQRFGISKLDYYSRCSCDIICSCPFNFNITFLNFDLRQGRDNNKPRNRKFALLRGKTE